MLPQSLKCLVFDHRPASLGLSKAVWAALGCVVACASPTPARPAGADAVTAADAPASADAGDHRDSPAADGDAGSDGGGDAGPKSHFAQGPTWHDLGVWPLDPAGRTASVQVQVPAGQRFLAIRVVADAVAVQEPACLRLFDVRPKEGPAWVGPSEPAANGGVCKECSHKVQAQRGYGLFVFPNDGSQLADIGGLTLAVELRHCLVDVPLPRGAMGSAVTAVSVQWASEPQFVAATQGHLQVLLAVAKGALGAQDPPLAQVAAALRTRLQDALAPLAVDVGVAAATTISTAALPSLTPLQVSTEHAEELELLQAAADATWAQQLGLASVDLLAGQRAVPVVLVPCLYEEDAIAGNSHELAGKALRIPGGGRVLPYAALVLVATGRCSAAPPALNLQRLSTVATHEIGHYLGLYHSDQAEGLALAATGTDLMVSTVGVSGPWAAEFSPKQGEVIRRHLDVTY